MCICPVCTKAQGGTRQTTQYGAVNETRAQTSLRRPPDSRGKSFNLHNNQTRHDQSSSIFTPDFNPYYGQAGQMDEKLYRQKALLAFRRKQDAEREEDELYKRRRQAALLDQRRREPESAPAREAHEWMWVELTTRTHGQDPNNKDQSRGEGKTRR